MNLSDEYLKKAFERTLELTSDELFCGVWENFDLSTSAFPALTEPNKAHRIRGKYKRDGKLKTPFRFTPIQPDPPENQYSCC